MSRRPAVLAVAIAVAVLAVAGPACADDDKMARARALFDQAEAARARQEYQAAADLYLQAFDFFAAPEFYFNAAEAYRLADDRPKAVTYYQKYVDLDPDGAEAGYARQKIAELSPRAPAQPPPTETVPDDPKWNAEPGSGSALAPANPPGPAGEPARDAGRPGSAMKVAGIAVGGLGVVMVGVGIWAGLEARSISSELSEIDQWRPELDARFQEGKDYETAMFVCGAAGVVAAVAGGVLYLAGSHRATAASGVTIVPTAGGAGMAWWKAF